MVAWTFDGEFLDGAEREHVVLGAGPREALPGRFALAGLVDAHAHPSVAADEGGPYLADRGYAEAKLDEYAAHGVTVIRDAGGLNTVTIDFAKAPMPGRPFVTAAGRFLAPPSRYFPRMFSPTSADRLLDAIRDEIAAGAQWIKIIGDFPQWGDAGPVPDSLDLTYDMETLDRAVQLVHSLGARMALHSNLPASDLVAIGVDSFEHGTALSRDDVHALGARGGAWTPTLGAVLAHQDDPDPDARTNCPAPRTRPRDPAPRGGRWRARARGHRCRHDHSQGDRAARRLRTHRRTIPGRGRIDRAGLSRDIPRGRHRHLRRRPPLQPRNPHLASLSRHPRCPHRLTSQRSCMGLLDYLIAPGSIGL